MIVLQEFLRESYDATSRRIPVEIFEEIYAKMSEEIPTESFEGISGKIPEEDFPDTFGKCSSGERKFQRILKVVWVVISELNCNFIGILPRISCLRIPRSFFANSSWDLYENLSRYFIRSFLVYISWSITYNMDIS